MFKKKSDELSKGLRENAPAIAFWVASVILVLFDLRVLDVLWTITHSYLLAGGALFATSVMFFIWKNNFQYTLASKTQVVMATIGMVLALAATAIYGGMDYFLKGGLTIDTGNGSIGGTELVLWGVPTLSIIHVVMLLLYWYLDPVVTSDRKMREADDDASFAEREMAHAETLLGRTSDVFATFQRIASVYGREAALKQLANLNLDRDVFEKIEVDEPSPDPSPDPAMTGHGGHGAPATPPVIPGYYGQGWPAKSAMTGHGSPVPAPIPVPGATMTGNGNGHTPNPT